MKNSTKANSWLTSAAILATVGAQTVHANSCVVQDGDSFMPLQLQTAWIRDWQL